MRPTIIAGLLWLAVAVNVGCQGRPTEQTEPVRSDRRVESMPPSGARAEFSAVVRPSDGMLLGGVVNKEWAKAEAVAQGLRGGEKYQLYTLTKRLGEATGGKPEHMGDPCDWAFSVKIDPMPETPEDVIAIAGAWNALPRIPTVERAAESADQDAVREILQQKGIEQPKVKITQVLRADLDGDGIDEELLSATNDRPDQRDRVLATADPQPGDYTLVVFRKLADGEAQDTVVDGEYYPKGWDRNAPHDPSVRDVLAILDVDGDGRLEVLVRKRYHEGGGIAVYAVEGKQPKLVFAEGCGA
jgi:hypothetical protein